MEMVRKTEILRFEYVQSLSLKFLPIQYKIILTTLK